MRTVPGTLLVAWISLTSLVQVLMIQAKSDEQLEETGIAEDVLLADDILRAKRESVVPYDHADIQTNGVDINFIRTRRDVAFDRDLSVVKTDREKDFNDVVSKATQPVKKVRKRQRDRRKKKKKNKRKRRRKNKSQSDETPSNHKSAAQADSPVYLETRYTENTARASSRNTDYVIPSGSSVTRTNYQYFDTSYLKNYLDSCPNCMITVESNQCPLSDQALEMKKWANELQELLSYGCIKPEGCTESGICCVARLPVFEQSLVRITQMLKDLHNMFLQHCSSGNCPGSSLLSDWTEWGEWSSCDVTCGRGFRTRIRLCNGRRERCEGMAEDRAPCPDSPDCCVDGSWSSWSRWATCSTTCGRGQTRRRRSCSSPAPNYCGRPCPGSADETKTCGLEEECCVDGNWASWSDWTSCSTSCGPGTQSRIRRCSDPVPNFCGKRCPGQAMNTRDCRNPQCCVGVSWTTWSDWSSCSSSCQSGVRSRVRTCNTSGQPQCSYLCQGEPRQIESCGSSGDIKEGTWGSWQSWSACSVTCGRGYRNRRRSCDDPCGRLCSGRDMETERCDAGRDCCVDGNWGSWQTWSQCSATCGRGQRERERSCDNPPANYCGDKCPGAALDVGSCDSGTPCQVCVDGNWGIWESWSQCSVTCGRGSRERQRSCDNPPPNQCGQRCPGLDFKMETCDTGISCQVCVDGNWGTWESWSPCSVTCGRGTKERQRLCNNPPANYCGQRCPGRSFEVDVCGTGVPCKFCVDGSWGSWSSWSPCSVTCGRGQMERRRSCDNPPANDCGLPCPGEESEVDVCDTGLECKVCVDGNWGSWSSWSPCSVTCGRGQMERRRSCDSPAANDCGRPCPGRSSEVDICDTGLECKVCVDGNWGSWSSWSPCSVTCGRGQMERRRSCDSPAANDCGRPCPGRSSEVDICDTGLECKVCVDGSWGSWRSWSPCSVTCESGTRERLRLCDSPPANECGLPCPGEMSETGSCDTGVACQGCVDGNWGSWLPWSPCSVTCGRGTIERQRLCDNPPANYCGQRCPGREFHTEVCETGQLCEVCVDGNWGPWQSWSQCSTTCGQGTRERRRLCDDPPANYCGQKCPGREYDTGVCENDTPCETCVDGNWGQWQSWSQCSATCGRGVRERRRSCDSPPANYCGERCPGGEFETDSCESNIPCVDCVDGNWGSWSTWSSCPTACGDTLVRRTRSCNNPPANYCGMPCEGEDEDLKPRRCGPEPVDGGWATWTSWTSCSASCGIGSQERTHTCTNPPPNACGQSCPGATDERRTCVGSSICDTCEQKQWSSWDEWGECSTTCGLAIQSRTRTCQVLRQGDDCGIECPGPEREDLKCDLLPPCPVWGPWSACSVTCRGQGTRERVTTISEEVGRGDISVGADATRREVEICIVLEPECPAGDVSWSEWDSWCPCDCRKGVRTRRRDCQRTSSTGEVVKVSLSMCQGEARDDEECNALLKCPECITNCEGQQPGLYPSCEGCSLYIECTASSSESRACRNSEWDAFVSECRPPPSPSCMLHDCIDSCEDQLDGSYHSCKGCSFYVECIGGSIYERFCPGDGMEWNQHMQRCIDGRSPSCKRPVRIVDNMGIVHERPRLIIGGGFDDLYSRDSPAHRSIDDRYHSLTAEGERNDYEFTPKRRGEKRTRMEEFHDLNILQSERRRSGMANCKNSCIGVQSGKYPSCRGCSFYVLCTEHGHLRQRLCPGERQWDDMKKRCRPRSRTCT